MTLDNLNFFSVYSCDFDLELIEFNINHYISLGVRSENFYVILHGLDQTKVEQAYNICSKYFTPIFIWRESYNTEIRTRLLHAMAAKYLKEEDLIIYADADEFHNYHIPLPIVLEQIKENKNIIVRGNLIDRAAADGSLPQIDTSKSLQEQFPLRFWGTDLLSKFGISPKIMIYRAWMKMSRGFHQIINNYGIDIGYWEDFTIEHFRWNSTILEKHRRRLKDMEGIEQKTSRILKSKNIIEYLELNKGLRLEDLKVIYE